MDRADLLARQRLLTEPLADVLAAAWPAAGFVLEAQDAQVRPGAAVTVVWTDGPSVRLVEQALAPRWSPDGPDGYPVLLARGLSPATYAAGLIELSDAVHLAPAVQAGRAAFFDVLEHRFDALSVPEDLSSTLRARADLVVPIATTAVGPDVFAWASWLCTDGQHVLADTVPAALS
jgi:hypothetical protein